MPVFLYNVVLTKGRLFIRQSLMSMKKSIALGGVFTFDKMNSKRITLQILLGEYQHE